MHSKTILNYVTLTALFAAFPASAVVKIATYAGTIASGYDSTGVFGTANADLTGARYVAAYTYDVALAEGHSTGSSWEYIQFGTYYGYYFSPKHTPAISATVTINGVTQSVGGAYRGQILTDTTPTVDHLVSESANNGDYWMLNEIYNFAHPTGAPGSLNQNFGPSVALGGGGWVNWIQTKLFTGPDIYRAYANFNDDAVYTVGDPSIGNAVPEPASWTLMIAGFGMVGGALRGRRAIVRPTSEGKNLAISTLLLTH